MSSSRRLGRLEGKGRQIRSTDELKSSDRLASMEWQRREDWRRGGEGEKWNGAQEWSLEAGVSVNNDRLQTREGPRPTCLAMAKTTMDDSVVYDGEGSGMCLRWLLPSSLSLITLEIACLNRPAFRPSSTVSRDVSLTLQC